MDWFNKVYAPIFRRLNDQIETEISGSGTMAFWLTPSDSYPDISDIENIKLCLIRGANENIDFNL